MTRLLVINQFASTPSYSSGAGERYFYFSRMFALKNITTTIISASFNHLFLKYPKTTSLFTTEKIEGGQFIWLKVRRYNANSLLGRVFNLFEFTLKLFLLPKRILKGTDLIIVSSMSIFPVVFAVFAKRIYKIPFILEIRDIWPLTPIQMGGYSPKHPYMRLIGLVAKIGYKESSRIISVLPNFGEYLKEYLNISREVVWIPNGIDAISNLQIKKRINKRSFDVMYTGALGEANALEYLIEAAKMIDESDNVIITIVGNGPSKDKLMEESKNLSFVRFLNKVPKNKVKELLSNADCCYLGWRSLDLYKYGISPNKLNDYMGAGKPIISSSPCYSDPVIVANCGLHVEAENSKEIFNAIMKMKNFDPQERERLGLNGFNYLKCNNSYEVLSKRFMDVIFTLKK
jgi:glycosyltransferase involved in cell wall biosynthesis